jgi:hypothetical protein
MPRLSFAALLVFAALPARADPIRTAGWVEGEKGRFEILGRPLHAGDRIELPEGFLVVEEDLPDDGAVGSFGVVSAETFKESPEAPQRPADTFAPGGGEPALEASALAAPGGACRNERAAYLAELWSMSGIEVKDPVALLEGLEAGGSGALSGYYSFAFATDAFRPLAWSSELRSRANDLARCAREVEGSRAGAGPAPAR